MNKNLLTIRVLFMLLVCAGTWLVSYTIEEWDRYRGLAVVIGILIGVLVILVDIFLKGFSLRGLSAVTFGLAMGSLAAFFISVSPLFDEGDPQLLYLSRLALFVICSYLGAVLALRGKDEFNLVIPYVRFVPHGVDVPLIVVDASTLIDGRIAKICETQFISSALVVPQFVLEELHRMADSADPVEKEKGRRGIHILTRLRRLPNVDLRIEESRVAKQEETDAKLIFLAHSLKAKLLTPSFNLAKLAEFHGIASLNINRLMRAVAPALEAGETLVVKLVKPGKEKGQAVGFAADGTTIVVGDAVELIGEEVVVEITGVLPTGGGKLLFAKLADQTAAQA